MSWARWQGVVRIGFDGSTCRVLLAVAAAYAAGLVLGVGDPASAGAPPVRELVELRTPTSRTYAEPGGRRRTVVYTDAIHRSAGSAWQPLRRDVAPAGISGGGAAGFLGGYAWAHQATASRTLFKSSMGPGFMRLETGGSHVDLTLEGAVSAFAAVTGDRVRYTNALPSTDLLYETAPSGVKEQIVLRSHDAPSRFRFRLTPPAGERLTAVRLRSGDIRVAFASGASMLLQAPYAVDASAPRRSAGDPPAPGDRSHAALDLQPAGDGYVIDVSVDREWLESPRRRFPVVVDPTVIIHSPVARAEFPQCSGCVGADPGSWRVGSDYNRAYRSAFRFDLIAVPTGANVTSARFVLTGGACLLVNGACYSGPHDFDVHRATTSWAAGTPSGDLRIAGDPEDSAQSDPMSPSATANVAWDGVGAAVRDWVNGRAANYGFVVKAADERLANGGGWFNGAFLEVVWSDEAPGLEPPRTLHSNGAHLQWRAPSSFAGGAFDRYEVHRSRDAGFTPSQSTLVATLRDPAATSYRDTTAAPNQTFSYKVVANGVLSVERRVKLPSDGSAVTTVTADDGDGQDTYLVENSCSNHGLASELEIAGGATRRRALLSFDLGEIPSDATVSNAELAMYVSSASATQGAVRPYAVTTAWKEGGGRYGLCTGTGATWSDAAPGQRWAEPGGDHADVGEMALWATAASGWQSMPVTRVVENWIGSGRNHGLMLRYADESVERMLSLAATELSAGQGPRLVVSYHDGSDAIEPEVAVTAPSSSETVRGTVAVSADAGDDGRISQVQFFVDGALRATDTAAPYVLSWNTTAVGNGTHTITAKATDDAGNTATSTAVPVTVGNSQPPQVSITSHVDRYDRLVKQHNPTAYWRLDETSGTVAADSSGNGRAGTYSGSFQLGVPAIAQRGGGTAALFRNAATDGRVSAGVGTNLGGAMTAEAWVNSASLPAGDVSNHVLSRGWGQPGGWSLSLKRISVGYQFAVFAINKGGTVYEAQSVLTPGRLHLAGTYDGNVARLYVNGAEFASTTVGAVSLNTSATVSVGQTLAVDTTIDEAAVYGRALSAGELRSHTDLGDDRVPTVSSDVTVTASASDDGSVARVQFLVDGSVVAEDTSAPFTATLPTLDPDAPIYDGRHTITARAHDNHGQETDSASVEVEVANAPAAYQAEITELTPTPETVDYDPGASDQRDHGVTVKLTNESSSTWSTSDVVATYRWKSPDPTAEVIEGPETPLPGPVAPGQSAQVDVMVEPPPLPAGVERARYTLQVDAKKKSTDEHFADKGNKPHEKPVNVDKTTNVETGLEQYYPYDGDEVGAGMVHLVNVASGNSLLQWTPFSAPGRGLSTQVDITYNALEKKSESPIGNNFSLAISGLTRFGNPIDIHPNKADQIAGNANKYVEIVDGDGTTHRFIGRQAADGSTYWEEPAGVHLYLRSLADGNPKGKWAFTRPDRVTFYFDADGFPLSIEDANGNRITYALENTPPGEDPGGPKKRITRVTDAGGRSFTISYFSKADAKKAHIRGKIKRISDHTGSALDFVYYEDGNLQRLVQRGGAAAGGRLVPDRAFDFAYTTSSGSGPATNPHAQSTRIYSVRDPRGTLTTFSYVGEGGGDDRWKLATRTDRTSAQTTYSYDDANRLTTVTAPLSRITKYRYDANGQPTAITNPKNETTTIGWTPDRHVESVTRPGDAHVAPRTQRYEYNANGLITAFVNEENHRTDLFYDSLAVDGGDVAGRWKAGRTIPHVSDVARVRRPRGFEWTFRYDQGQPYPATERRGNVSSVTDPENATTAYRYRLDGTVETVTDPRSNVTTLEHDANGLPSRITDGAGNTTRFGYDADGLLRWVQDPSHAASPLTGNCDEHGVRDRDWRVCMDYDPFHRLIRRSEPKSTEHARGLLLWSNVLYDLNDNVVEAEAPHAGHGDFRGPSISTFGFDDMDRVRFQVGPDRSAGEERTTYDYDVAGRLKQVTTPRGVASTSNDRDHAVLLDYDGLDRIVTETRHRFDPGKTETLRTYYCYDIAGDLRSVTRPKANAPSVTCAPDAQGVTHTWRYEYYPDGLLKRTTDPLGHQTRAEFDANDNLDKSFDEAGTPTDYTYNRRDELVQVDDKLTATKLITAKYEYDPAGNLKKQISPRAVDNGTTADFVTTYDYDGANRQVKVTLPRGPDTPQAYVHRRFDGNGRLTMASLPSASATEEGLDALERTSSTYWDPGWVRTTDSPGTPKSTYDYSPEGWQTKREARGGDGRLREMTWDYYADGQVRTKSGREGDRSAGVNEFTYDLNNNLTRAEVAHGSLQAEEGPKTLDIRWDTLDRLAEVHETSRNPDRVDTFDYDLNGNVSTRVDDAVAGQLDTTGRQHDFTWDQRDMLDFHYDHGKDRSALADDRDVDVAYTPIRKIEFRAARAHDGDAMRAKQRTEWTYFLNGRLETLHVKNGSGDTREHHEVSYLDTNGRFVNGHRVTDAFRLVGPDESKPCRTTTCTRTYTYDARDRVRREVTTPTDVTATYDFDVAGNLERKTMRDGGTTTKDARWTYRGTQIEAAIAPGAADPDDPEAVIARYWHDAFGNLECVTGKTSDREGVCGSWNSPSSRSPLLFEHYEYDLLDRMVSGDRYSGGRLTSGSSNVYDPLDRVTERRERKHLDGDGSLPEAQLPTGIRKFHYVGLTRQVSNETWNPHRADQSSNTKDYSYDALGMRIGLTARRENNPPKELTYAYNVHSDVSLLLGDDGNARASYGYLAYGDTDEQLTDERDFEDGSEPEENDPTNQYRYSGRRTDPGSETIDMGARRFSPDTGGFLQADQFQGALSNLSLSTDPLTANRYSLAAGNPVGFVEWDGHMLARDGSGGGSSSNADDNIVVDKKPNGEEIVYSDDSTGLATAPKPESEGQLSPEYKMMLEDQRHEEAMRQRLLAQPPRKCPDNAWGAVCAAAQGLEQTILRPDQAAAGFWYELTHTGTYKRIYDDACKDRTAGYCATSLGLTVAGTKGTQLLRGPGGGSRGRGGSGRVPCNCFPAGTLVKTRRASKPIEKVRVGDRVWARDLRTGRSHLRRVVGVFSKRATQLLTIEAGGTKVDVTPEHPMWIRGRGWVPASNLEAGDELLRRDGRAVAIESISSRDTSVTVHNFEVDGDHNYYVTKAQLLVHNCDVRPPSFSPPGAGRRGAFRAAKRNSGVPMSQEATRIEPNFDKRGNLQPGRVYVFELDNGLEVGIREDTMGHNYGPNDPQNRGPHFNDPAGRHYDY